MAMYNREMSLMANSGWRVEHLQPAGKKVVVTWYRDVPNIPGQVPVTPRKKGGLPAIAIIGIVVGVLFLFGIIAAAIGGNSSKSATATPIVSAIATNPTLAQPNIASQQATPTIAPATSAATATVTATKTPTVAATRAPTIAPSVAPTVALGKVGQIITVGSMAVTLNEVRDPAPAGQFFAPKAGNRYVALDVTIENHDSAKTLSFNFFYASVKDAEGHQYTSTVSSGVVEPPLGSGDIAPGDKVRGWLLFEVPVGTKLATFKYEPILSTRPVIFDISK